MNELTAEDYIEVLNGTRCGAQFSKDYVISRKEKNKQTQKQILLKEGVGLPSNMNDEYKEEKAPVKKKKKRNNVDPEHLRLPL